MQKKNQKKEKSTHNSIIKTRSMLWRDEMINKATKNALYAEILKESSTLLYETEHEREMKRENGDSEEQLNMEYKGVVLNYQRIRNNAFVMLLKGGINFYTNLDNWRNANNLFIKVNGEVYSLDLQNVKTLLSNETEKILDKTFSVDEKNVEIDLAKADKFAFKEYASQNDKVEKNISMNQKQAEPLITRPVAKENVSSKVQEHSMIQEKNHPKKDSQNTDKNQTKKPELKQVEKPEKSLAKEIKKKNGVIEPQENKKKKESKNQNKKPIKKDPIPVPSIDIDELFMDDDEFVPIQAQTNVKNDEKSKKETNYVTIENEKRINSRSYAEVNQNKKDLFSDNKVEQNPGNETVQKEKVRSNQQTPEEDDSLKMIDDAIDILEITSPIVKENIEPGNIKVDELIMDTYTVRFSEKGEESSNENKTFTIIVAPLGLNGEINSSFAPTVSFARIGRTVCTCASQDKIRPSYQIMLDNETFVVRGGWNQDGFYSVLYPQNTNNKAVSIQKRQIKPIKEEKIGHNVSELDNGIRIHILPLSSRNADNGKVGFLVCLEDPIEEKNVTTCTKEKSYVDVLYNNITYRISAYWENKELISSIQIL